MDDKKLIVAFDFPANATTEAEALLEKLDPQYCRLKVGKEMFTARGPDWVAALQNKGFDVFLDLKFHDIPNTVAGALKAAADLGVWMVNVHALGGPAMLAKAREALSSSQGKSPLLIAVTVLTSMDVAQLNAIGFEQTPLQLAQRLATLAAQAGLDGVVCSAHEAGAIKAAHGPDFLTVCPGIRPQQAQDDQQRVMTPAKAVAAGADYLVIGRPITQAADPMAVVEAILSQV